MRTETDPVTGTVWGAAGLSVVRGHGGPRAGSALRGSAAATSLGHTRLDRPQPASVLRGREPRPGHLGAARRGTAITEGNPR